jgi:NADP-dependent 3-hydroxy acid dehydrogenase YdfG
MTDSTTNYVDGKVIVITGAGSGFGRLVSQQTALLGAKVICADINEAGVAETVASITQANGTASAAHTDVTSRRQMQALAEQANAEHGAIDVWINNAGIMPLAFHRDHEAAAELWDKCIDINIKGVINGISACHDTMLAQGCGHVINLSSIYSNAPVAGAGVYGATKAAVNFLSESLRVESQGKIKVTIVRPTGVPNTGLGANIVNPEALVGILGQNAPGFFEKMAQAAEGKLDASETSAEAIGYIALDPEHLAEQIVYAINQPWGVSIGDITVRASGDAYVI